MMFHAALDRLEELLGSNKKTSWKRFQRGSHWIGKICPMEEYEVNYDMNKIISMYQCLYLIGFTNTVGTLVLN